MTEVKVSFPTQDNLQLEGLFNQGGKGHGGIILCHPHPLYGGDMHNNVVSSLQSALAGKGFSTLRFNFRGVGKSKGSYANGIGEEEDVWGAVEFVLEQADLPLILVGYSFGAAVGAHAVGADTRIKALICISPPIETYDFSFLKDDIRPKLFIAGDRDDICPVKPLRDFLQSLPQPRSLRVFPDVDHFWGGMEDRVAESVVDFLQGLEWG